MPTNKPEVVLPELARRAIPFLRDEGANYEDDGSNEPLELAREIEAALAADTLTCPAGGDFVMVPREPTEEMLDAFHDKIRILCNPEERSANIQNDVEVWQAILDAFVQDPTDTNGGHDGEWFCEAHPWAKQGHDGCGGAGIPSCARIPMLRNMLRFLNQRLREQELIHAPVAEAMLSAAPQQHGQEVGECAANGFGHKFGPHGPGRSIQCEYCGEPQQPAEAVAWIAEKTGRSSFTGKVRTDRAAFLTYPADAEADGYRITPLYLTQPPAIDIGKLRELVSEWRSEARDIRDRGMACNHNSIFARADQLAALIGDGVEKGNG